MRWQGQSVATEGDGALPGMAHLPGLVRSVTTPEFAGVTFHEVRAKSALNKIPPAAELPFQWTINPYRGCTHACVYCFARGSHAWLELDTGTGFDKEIVVKTNVADVVRREVNRSSWGHEHVALGTNTDPYQRAEGRYRLMPGIITALADSGTPFSILTKGTTLRRDLPLISSAGEQVSVGMGVSIAVGDQALHESLEPGTPSPRARLDLVSAISGAGLRCNVMVAPVLPWITDSSAAMDDLLSRIAAAGATSATLLPLHLKPGAREWYLQWLSRERPDLVLRYTALYEANAFVPQWYAERLRARAAPLLHRHGLGGSKRTPGHRAIGARGTEEVDETPTLF